MFENLKKFLVEELRVKAEDVTGAVKNLTKHMEDSIMDYDLVSVNESAIVDTFHYEG